MMPPPSPQTSKWVRMQLALFLLAVPSLSLGEIQTNTAQHSTPETLLLRKKVTISDNGNKKFHELDASAEFKEDESTEFDSIDFDDDNIVESEITDVHRDLSSDSNSRDEADDFWRNPKYWDDYNNPVDDEFYRYNGDSDRPHLNPIGERDMVGFMLASLGATLGSLGGIGGGGLVVPCYVIVTRLNLKQAIPLGSVTVLGGSLAALMLNLKRRHPLADRPIIDWDLILVMEPLVLVGTLFGSILHRVVTGKILSVLLVLLLSIVAHTTLVKARRMFNAEKRYIEHLKKSQLDYLTRVQSFRTAAAWGAGLEAAESKASYLPAEPTRTLSMDSQTIATATQAPISPRMNIHEKQRILILNPDFVTLRSDLMEQEKVTPRSKILLLLSKFSVLMFLNIMLGGGAFKSPWGIQCGGFAYWIVHIIMVAFLFSSAWAAQTYLTNRHELKEIIRFDYVHGDIKWDQRRSVVYPLFFMLAGLLAGMFGSKYNMRGVPGAEEVI